MADGPEKDPSSLLPPPEDVRVKDLPQIESSSIKCYNQTNTYESQTCSDGGSSIVSSKKSSIYAEQAQIYSQSRQQEILDQQVQASYNGKEFQKESYMSQTMPVFESVKINQNTSVISQHDSSMNRSEYLSAKRDSFKPSEKAAYNWRKPYSEIKKMHNAQNQPIGREINMKTAQRRTKNHWPKYNTKKNSLCVGNSENKSFSNTAVSFKVVNKKYENQYKPGPSNSRIFEKPSTGFKLIEELSMKEPAEITMILASERSGFDELLKRKLNNYQILKIVHVLSKLCDSEFKENKTVILSTSCQDHFIDQILLHVNLLPLETDVKIIAEINQFIKNLINFFTTIMRLLPITACNCCEKIFTALAVALKNLELYKNMSFESELEKVGKLQRQLAEMISLQQIKIESHTLQVKNFQPPPDNFREISLYPTPADILGNETVYLRPNVITGAYEDVEHYLDVQFRLLREDFLNPLREGISVYLRSKNDTSKMRQSSVRVYEHVQFIGPDGSINSIGMRILFDVNRRLRYINWEQSRRFMSGSLLCFSGDNFKSIFFGTVLVRKTEDLIEGELIISLATDCDLPSNIYINEFVMVESEIYFEPYYNVMEALQNMYVDSFPMKKYIVEAQTTSAPPQYVSSIEYDETFRESWLDVSLLNLDDSQYQAYKTGLTREFVVIQGPPGTGKTYLGLQIVKKLLDNSKKWCSGLRYSDMWDWDWDLDFWDSEQSDPELWDSEPWDPRSSWTLEPELNTPMLIVCNTNHALDQFLEGLLGFTHKIVRVGGRSKSKALAEFNLNYRRSLFRTKERYSFLHEQRVELENILDRIRPIETSIKYIERKDHIVSFRSLKCIIRHHRKQLEFEDENMFLEWLIPEYGAYAENTGKNELRKGIQLNNFDIFETHCDSSVNFALSIHDLDTNLKLTRKHLHIVQKEMEVTGNYNPSIWMFEEEIGILEYVLQHCKLQMGKKYVCSEKFIDDVKNGIDLWMLSQDDRWCLYFHWLDLLKNDLKIQVDCLSETFQRVSLEHREGLKIEDLRIMRQSLVVGMTTSGAARFRSVLQSLQSKIVIVEEAAEVMESHVVASLTKYCQHLILIGDHQQLRPNTADYDLAKKFHFNISLFERMVKNGVHCETLKVQRRMRPEIAKLIVPSIYPDLENHSSVLNFENIKGVIKNVFFMTHNQPEENCADSSSRRNVHEAHFTLALCKYLLMQGYSPDEITILTTYSGQMFLMENIKYRYIKKDVNVKITVVDNYQGEENDIILLSLVRSNNEGNIGFLKLENRVCVALSRGKKGLFMIGNMDILREGSTIWPRIKEVLDEQNAIDTKMVLRCQIHPQQWSFVENSEDFRKNSPEGGCKLMCEVKLKCGHSCPRVCHIKDRDHEESKCVEPCNRELPCGHSKELPCDVDHMTYNCDVEVDVVMPHCNHKVKKPCHVDVGKYKCSEMCEDRLPCGHSCEMKCHVLVDPDHLEYNCMKDCTKKNKQCSQNHKCEKRCHEPCGSCEFKVKRKLPKCDHVHEIFCSVDPSSVLCGRRCKTKLDCGHDCPLLCYEKCGQCPIIVEKLLTGCNHSVKTKCCEEPDPKRCNGPCVKILKCGHQCNTKCCNTCTTSCMVLVNSSTLPACGHNVKIPCHLNQLSLPAESLELLSYCEEPCGKVLKCNHVCKGKCGECLQGRVHMPCKEKCGKTLICGHSCEAPCAENCPPCMKKCDLVVCQHSKCSKRCGEPCTRCKEHCRWRCEHSRCSKPCYEMCDREACTLPCEKLLKCNHPCIGFCGDPCPPLCRECNRDEVTEILFGNEDEDDTRFVYLVDCEHVIEARGLENWLQQSSEEIGMKTCPKCKTPIMKTVRFRTTIKKTLGDIFKVKKKVLGKLKEMNETRDELQEKLLAIKPSVMDPILESEEIGFYFDKLLESFEDGKNNGRNILSKIDIETLAIRIQILVELVAIVEKVKYQLSSMAKKILRKHMDVILQVSNRNPYVITAQEVCDLNYELKRFQRMVQLCVIESCRSFSFLKNVEKIRNLDSLARGFVFSMNQFSDMDNTETKVILEELNTELKTANIITDTEHKDIVRVIDFRHGYWYKYRNGNVYAIENGDRLIT